MGWTMAAATFEPYLEAAVRKTYAPGTKPKYIRGVDKEPLPSPVKRSRPEPYQEVRRVQKPAQRVIESKPVNSVKVIEKKAELYAAAVEKPLPQRKPATRWQPAAEKESKPVVDTARPVAKVPKKTEAKGEVKKEPAVKEVKAEKENAIAPEDTKPTVEPNADGKYELSPVMSSSLHDELQQIMIKVWQVLPDEPPTEAEELVATKFRNEAGDDLQIAMGLSATTRLLNVHNPLYVKLHFSGKPEAGRLQAFIREHKITAFKRIGDSLRDTFAARFDRIVDFDRFCVHDQVKCGSATVHITPCYKYLSCPPNVKTIYDDNNAKTKTQASSPQKQADTDKKEKSESAEVKKVVVKKTNTETEKSESKTNTTANKTAANNKEAVKTVPAKVENTKTVTNTKETTEPKVTPKKENKEVVKKNDVVDKKKELVDIDDMMVVDEMGEDDVDQEMTDQDILALMSGGIVLDECSGSEDEK